MTPSRIAELRALAGAATPGPWGWCGNLTTHEIYLATVKCGRVYVMDFVRWGMTGAAPRFQCDHIMERVDKLAVREVPYRGHFDDLDHPDARYIVAACNELPAALDEIERLRGLLREAHGTLRPFAEIGRVVSEAPSSSDGPVLHVWVRRSGEAELTTLDCLRAAGLRGRIEDALKGSE